MLKRLVFNPFYRLFIEYFVKIFLILLVLNFTRRHGVYGAFFNDTEAPSVQGATELVSKLCSGGMPKAFVSKVIKNL